MQNSISKTFSFEGNNVSFRKGNYVMVSATEMAKPFGKRPFDWLKTQSTKDFIETLSGVKKIVPSDLVVVINGDGGGTWLHEDVALEFARWLAPRFAIWCNDRIKELLTTGMTAIPGNYLEALKALVASEEEKQRLQETNQKLLNDNNYKSEIIEGLTENIPVADMRQRINQIVRKGGVNDIHHRWAMLYDEFDRKFHMKVWVRISNAKFKGNSMDYIDTELNMIPELYELACKLFESSYRQLMESWGRFARRAELLRIKR